MDLKESNRSVSPRHPWEIARFRFFLRVLQRAQVTQRPLRILDVGSGDAWFASQLIEVLGDPSSCVCWDIGYTEHELPLAFKQPALAPSAVRPQGKFDLILLLDVSEHVADDHAFLADILENCAAPGAYVLFSVPAWPGLMSSRDAALRHCRRYRPGEGRRLLCNAGLEILLAGGVFHGLLVARGLNVLKERLLGSPPQPRVESLEWRWGPFLGKTIEAVLVAEGILSRWLARHHKEWPGLSWWALCQK